MTKSDTYIQFIIDQLKKGKVDWKSNVSVFCGKFRLSEKTFDKYWKLANEAHSIEQGKINELKSKEYTQSELEAFKSKVLSAQEKREKLKQIVNGELLVEKLLIIKGEPKKIMSKPDHQDIMKAIDIDNKMTGDNAIVNSSVTVKTDIPVINWLSQNESK